MKSMWKKKKYIKGAVKIGKQTRGVIWQNKSTLSIIFSSLAVIWMGAALTIAGVTILPAIWYKIQPNTSMALAQVLQKPVVSFEDALIEEGIKEEVPWQPEVDEKLPLENRLVIEKIGINTELVEAPLEDYESAFRQGVWRVPNFGTPFDRNYPVILAAHRFGYLSWTNDYRFKNSFYKLPQIKEGEEVSIIWQQRQYDYQIYGAEEGEEITDYTADLILYTCKFLESDDRIFRYARLITK